MSVFLDEWGEVLECVRGRNGKEWTVKLHDLKPSADLDEIPSPDGSREWMEAPSMIDGKRSPPLQPLLILLRENDVVDFWFATAERRPDGTAAIVWNQLVAEAMHRAGGHIDRDSQPVAAFFQPTCLDQTGVDVT